MMISFSSFNGCDIFVHLRHSTGPMGQNVKRDCLMIIAWWLDAIVIISGRQPRHYETGLFEHVQCTEITILQTHYIVECRIQTDKDRYQAKSSANRFSQLICPTKRRERLPRK